MSARRFLILLAAALLAIAGAVWLSAQRHLPRATLAGDPVLGELKPVLNAVTRLRLAKGDGSQVVLQRQGNGWMVEERAYPADSGRVRKVLLDLATLVVVEEKTHDLHSYPRLGVEEPTSPSAQGVLVEITAGAPLPALIVGKASGSKEVFVRRRGAEASFLATPQLILDTAPRSWLDHALLDVKAERVREVTVTLPAKPPYTARRAKPGDAFEVTPLPKGRTLSSPTAADAAGSVLASFSIDDVRAQDARAVAEPAAAGPYHAAVRTFDGLVVELDGRTDGERRYLRLLAQVDPSVHSAAIEHEAGDLNARAQRREFEIATYRFESIFRPLETLLNTPAQPPTKPAARISGSAPPAPPQ